ncbi:DNA polymerase zeta catalytic subunit, putative [Eimeria praecox]|uniref:DNA-directed DNA polymerase n=1 Tax=Eimeria praecox TaxID=51316 RepID=U6H684_9EIME|nr:DNA polymerase zeta catalytic subunit, putative [Eimeria praecox]
MEKHGGSAGPATTLQAPGPTGPTGAQRERMLRPDGGCFGMAVTAAVIEIGLDPPIKGVDPLVSEVCGRPLERVPIVRIYGPWGTGGPHCCLHLHGLFPYFYVPAPPEAYGEGATGFLRSFARRLVLEADRLMASKARGPQKESLLRGARKRRQEDIGRLPLRSDAGAIGAGGPKGGPLVQKIEVVRRLPFYGYHRDFHFFLKIYLTVPEMVGPLAGLLLKGVVTGSPLQPFEVHLSFQTQVLADLHLKGMAPVFVYKPFFRLPVILHPLAAAGINVDAQGDVLSTDGSAGPLGDESWRALNPEFEMLGIGAPRTFAALGWGRLLQQMHRLQQRTAAAEKATAPGPAAATAADKSTNSSSSSSCSAAQLCELIINATPPRGPQGLRLLSVPRRSKCVLEADARVEQVLNPIAAAEMAETEAAAIAEAAQNKQEQQKTQEGMASIQRGQQKQATSHNLLGCSNSSSSSMDSSERSSRAGGKAFSARLVGSVAEYWREEAARAAALGFPPPSASGWGPQGGVRDPYGAVAPELWRKALQGTLKRIEAWRQQQQHRQQDLQALHQQLPVQQSTSSAHASHREKQQLQQRQQANVEVIPSSLSSNWEASQHSVASDPEVEDGSCTPGFLGVCAALPASLDAPFHSPGSKPQEARMLPQGRLGHSLARCSSQTLEGAPRFLSQARPPSQKASIGLQPDTKASIPTREDMLDLADLGDEAFAALLASQGAETPSAETGPPEPAGCPQEALNPVPVELQAASGGSNADCSSLSDNSWPRHELRHQGAPQSSGIAPGQPPRKATQCSSSRCGQCPVSSSSKKGSTDGSWCCNCARSSGRKRCSSDMEDLLLACEATRLDAGEARDAPYSLLGKPSSSSCALAACAVAAPRSLPEGDSLGASCLQSAVSGFPRAQIAATAEQITTAAAETGASSKTLAAAGTPVAGSASDGSETANSSSSYTPTVKLGPCSSCEDLSPTQPMAASQLGSVLSGGIAGGSSQAATAAAADTATAAMLAAAADFAVDAQPVGTKRSNRRSNNRGMPSGPPTRSRARRASAPSESSISVVSLSPTPAALLGHAAATAASGATEVAEEITPFYSNPRDVPAAVNPLIATPGGRLLQHHQRWTPPPCTCMKATEATGATTMATGDLNITGRVELRSELLRFLHRQLRQHSGQRYPQQQMLQGQQRDRSRCCFVYFRPPPDDSQVFGSCPLKVRRVWQRAAQCELQEGQQQQQNQLHQQQLLQTQRSCVVEIEHSPNLRLVDKEGGSAKDPVAQQHQQKQEPEQQQQVHHREATKYGEMVHPKGDRRAQKEIEPTEADIACPLEARNSHSCNSSSSRTRKKVCMATRLDNNGRIVSYVAPQPQQQQQKALFAAANSDAAASQGGSSSSSSQREHCSQVSVASDVLKAKKGLFDQTEEGTDACKRAMGALTGSHAATYGALLALEIITECPAAAETEAAAATATPNPWTCAVLAICFVLRDERLQHCAARLQKQQHQLQQQLDQQQQQELLYSDVSGVIIYDPIGPFGVSCWGAPLSDGVPQRSSCSLGRIDSCIDRQWWRCVVSSEKELLLQFCSVIAAADPSLLLQWEEGGRGFKFLGRRAAALGIGHLFKLRCSRRADDISSSPVCSGAARVADAGPGRVSGVPGMAGTPTASGAISAVTGRPEVRRGRRWVRGSSAVSGRLVLEGWRLLQKEMKLHHSDLNGVAADVLGIISPSIPPAVVAAIWQQAQQTRKRKMLEQQQQHQSQYEGDLWALQSIADVLSYIMNRVRLCLRLLDNSELLPRTCELARLYGCSLHSALTRGSQFKVESILLRATKRLNCVLVSPSKQQARRAYLRVAAKPVSPACSLLMKVTEQPATVGVPLVLEPLSGFYFSPVLVLDFLSLYPSIVIANNICYSTCLGSVEVDPLESETKTLGVLTVHMPPQIFAQVMQEHADATATGPSSWPSPGAPGDDPMRVLPGGCLFVSRRVRQGILPTLLNDILQTRLMVKQAAKRYQGGGIADETLLRKLDYRQFGLKMIANVTYGYTNANVSGRMPCADVADAIVETARATLIRAMQLIEQTQKWGARVLYGDTDSIFVLLKGRSLEAAFAIGREIAEVVTRSNPAPITLQLEKVYLPCCLITKKRYVGNAYFSPSEPPTFDAKGIETIRRDQCPLTSAILEKSLRVFFQTRDLSKVKELLYRQWSKMLRGQVPIRHYIFHRRAKLGTYRAETGEAPAGTLPPQAKVLYERLHHQGHEGGAHSAADCYGIRVPFVFSQVAGDTDVPLGSAGAGLRGGSARLIDCATSPENVWGGRRDAAEMQALLRGRAYACLRPCSLLLQPEEDFLQQQQQQKQHPVVQLHYRYYITKQIIPAIDRLFSLLPPPGSADLMQWFRDMPKPAQPLAAAVACRSPLMPRQQKQQLLGQQQQSLLQQLGIRSLTASGTVRERLVLQRFFAGASCLFCGSRCRELGPLPLYSSSRTLIGPTQTNKRKKAMRFSAEEAEEAAVRRNLVQQLLQTCFSSPSGSSSCEEEERPLMQELLQKEKRKGVTTDLTKREVVLVPPPVCKECSSNPALVCFRLHQQLNKIERRLAAATDLCRHCAGSRICAESCLQAWHCDVYYRRNSEAEKLKAVQYQMQNLGIYIDS